VRKHALDLSVLFLIATGGCMYVALAVPADRRLAEHVYVCLVGLLLMGALMSALSASVPRGRRSELTRALETKPQPDAHASDLARMERTVTLGVGNAHDLHLRLLPLLRDIASMKLERAGRRPGPETLGRWWELLRPDRPAPEERFARGISEADLRALVADLERM
jgi:hypothetical protein